MIKNKDNKKTIHFLIFIISGIGIIVNFLYFFFFIWSKNINEKNILFYFSYLTHLTNISVFIWYGLSTIGLFLKKEMNFWNSMWIKGLVNTSIIFVGCFMIPFIFVIFPIFILLKVIFFHYSFSFQTIPWFKIFHLVISNLFVHIVVPIIVLYELLKFGIKKGEKKIENNKFSFFLYTTLFFVLYLFWVVLLTGTIIDSGPYPIMDFFNYSNWKYLLISLGIDFFILIIYQIMNYFILKKIKFIK